MGRRERRRFTDEFKAEVVGLVRSGQNVAEVSRDLDLTQSAVR
ncbi:MAG: transposase, partial [Candidatus Dormibacteria bacterium]